MKRTELRRRGKKRGSVRFDCSRQHRGLPGLHGCRNGNRREFPGFAGHGPGERQGFPGIAGDSCLSGGKQQVMAGFYQLVIRAVYHVVIKF